MIYEFQGEYSWLSNFWQCRVMLDSRVYPTVEHAYQAAKTLDDYEKIKILHCTTPGLAKRLGRTVTMRSDWNRIKVDVMKDLLYQKFTKEPFHSLLLATGEQEIQEGNAWGDKFWGRTKVNGKWVGRNVLGKLIMEIRSQLKEAK